MRRLITLTTAVALVATAAPVLALQSGTDIIVPAAGRGGGWVTDLYVANSGAETTNGSVYWLVRDQANPAPVSVGFTLAPGETAVFADIINADFGMASGSGAFRVTSDDPVIVNSRIYSAADGSTFGQGFEGVPVGAATQNGGAATVVGLSYNSTFRTNVYATAGSDGATMTLSLVEPSGNSWVTTSLTLGAWEPYLERVERLFGSIGNFDDNTLMVAVTAGSVVIGASKVDNASGDPTTLESDATVSGSASADGTYQISIYDSVGFATGGNIVIDNDIVTMINGTYSNWDKEEGGEAACTLLFLWGQSMSPTPLADFASGVTFSDSFASTGSGVMEWTVTFTVEDNMEITGSVVAEGSDFTEDDDLGCNGSFPLLHMYGGKSE